MAEEKVKISLPKGTLCRMIVSDHKYIKIDEVIEFINYNWITGYTFKLADGMRTTLIDENDFLVIPTIDTIRFMIDIALSTKDEEWFNELVLRLGT